MPILDALTNVKDATGNAAMAQAIQNIHDSIRGGESITKPLRAAKICDEMVVNMVEVGEETGELDKMLTKVADNYDDEVDRAVEAMVPDRTHDDCISWRRGWLYRYSDVRASY